MMTLVAVASPRLRAMAVAGVLGVTMLSACDSPSDPDRPPPAVATVEINEPAVLLMVGADRQLGAVLKAADGTVLTGRTVSWSVDDTTVATVSASGFVVGRAAGTAIVTASSDGKAGTAQLTVTNPVPSIASLSPEVVAAGSPGFTLTVTGSGFAPGAIVRVNGATRPPAHVTGTELRAGIPAEDIAEAGELEVVVFNPGPGGGTSDPAHITVDPSPQPNPQPVLHALAPGVAVAGSPGFTLIVLGTGFIPSSEVVWNGVARATTYAGFDELRTEIAASDIATSGTVQVAVRSPAPGGGTSNTRVFTVATPHAGSPVPVIDMVSPNTLDYGSPAQTLTVYGSGFVPASVVRLNGTDRPTVYHGSGTLRVSLTAADLAAARTFGLTVFNPAPGGGTSNVAQIHVRVCCFDLLYEGPADGRRELLKLPISSVWTAPMPLLTGVEAREPSASPDGRYVAFTGVDGEGGTDIYVVNLVTRDLQRLTFTGAADQPAWSGQHIAYRRQMGERGSIWVASSLSTPASGPWVHERISPPGVDDERPAWSPSSARIAFASNAGGSTDIWVMKPDGTGRRRITSAAAQETEPTWSPDGLTIAYTHIDAGGVANIRLTASGEGWVIINEPILAAGRLPAWSPDGQWIAFATDADGREDVGLIRPDGTGRVVLTATFDGGAAPAWIRLPR